MVESLPCSKFIAVRLSHNAVKGEDDLAALKRPYDELELEFKPYTGLTGKSFSIDDT